MNDFTAVIDFIRSRYPGLERIPLHAPVFRGNEKKYLCDCIDTTFVSYVGEYVTRFEKMVAEYLGVREAVAMVNGTVALQVALQIVGVQSGDEVITQALTFVGTANAIHHAGGRPVFIDSEPDHLGMDPDKLELFLKSHVIQGSKGSVINKATGKRIAACVPVHIFGHPARIEEITRICEHYHIAVVEDAAESIGSTSRGRHMGTFGQVGVLSFNGNKVITTGGGGMIVTDDEKLAGRARHLTTTAKVPHPWEYYHDEPGFNFRLTNVNAAIGCAQMEEIDAFLLEKRRLAGEYAQFFENSGIRFFREPAQCCSNYWLNAIILNNRKERDEFLERTNAQGIMTRPVWVLMNKLPMYKDCYASLVENANWLEDRLVNIPSGLPNR